ncbi:MAG: hypothetical protein LUE11_06030 [Clostridia bacterium]|nr:hypothetical protein [Clostridia bacterium]
MNRLKYSKGVLLVLIFVFLIFGVPILINECYKANIGYITLWGAADVLSYYGTLLGAAVAIFTLAVTIIFSRKQIIYEADLHQRQEKWNNIEKIINRALEDMHPLKMQQIMADAAENSKPEIFIIRLQMYEATARSSVDKVKLSVQAEEYEEIGAFIDEIEDAVKKFCEIKANYFELMQETMADSLCVQAVKNENADNALTSVCAISVCRDLMERENEIQAKLAKVYKMEYCQLLLHKKETFGKINMQIWEKAEKKLYF